MSTAEEQKKPEAGTKEQVHKPPPPASLTSTDIVQLASSMQMLN